MRNLHFVLLSFLLVSCFSSFFLIFLFLGIYLLGHCGNFFDTGVGSCRLRFFFLFFLLLFFLFSFFFSNRVVRKEVSRVKGVARIFQRGIAN